jgi:hypothetical protein
MVFTIPTPALITEDDAERTLTIGSSHFIKFSSASIVCPNPAARKRRTDRTSVGELQACNWAINGCVRRLFSVFFSYSFREASNMACKLEEEELEAVGVVLDMVAAAMRGLGFERIMWQCYGCAWEVAV